MRPGEPSKFTEPLRTCFTPMDPEQNVRQGLLRTVGIRPSQAQNARDGTMAVAAQKITSRIHAYYALLAACGPKAQALYRAAITYAHRHGPRIPLGAAEHMSKSPRPYSLINQLLRGGLWIQEGEYVTIADYDLLPRSARQRKQARPAVRSVDSTPIPADDCVIHPPVRRTVIRVPDPVAVDPDDKEDQQYGLKEYFVRRAARMMGAPIEAVLDKIREDDDERLAPARASDAHAAAKRAAEEAVLHKADTDPAPRLVAETMATARYRALAGPIPEEQRARFALLCPTLGEVRGALEAIAPKPRKNWGLVLWTIERQRQRASVDVPGKRYAAQHATGEARAKSNTYGSAGAIPISELVG